MHARDRQRDKPVVIVTGSSGLLGQTLIREFASSYQLVGFDRAGPPYLPPEAECVSVDVTDPETIARGLDRVRYAYGDRIASVVHLAAYYDFSGEPSDLYQEVTVRGTERLLRALKADPVAWYQRHGLELTSEMLAQKT